MRSDDDHNSWGGSHQILWSALIRTECVSVRAHGCAGISLWMRCDNMGCGNKMTPPKLFLLFSLWRLYLMSLFDSSRTKKCLKDFLAAGWFAFQLKSHPSCQTPKESIFKPSFSLDFVTNQLSLWRRRWEVRERLCCDETRKLLAAIKSLGRRPWRRS